VKNIHSDSIWEDRLLDCAIALIVALHSPLGLIPILINLMVFKSCTTIFVANTYTAHTSNTDADQILQEGFEELTIKFHQHAAAVQAKAKAKAIVS